MDSAEEVETYIKEALEDPNFTNYDIKFDGSTKKGDGYSSHFTFATVLGTTKDGTKKIVELAVKYSKKESFANFKNVYQREVYFYETILPEFTKFQKQNGIEEVFDSIPKMYKITSNEESVVCVMENLRKNGYDMYDCKKPLDLNHLKLGLREYGKLHAISFALRNKRKDDFEKLVTNFNDVMLEMLISLRPLILKGWDRACDILKETGEEKLYEICHGISQKGTDVVLTELLNTVEPQSAILHGDCWNNNFMYKYENPDVKFPSKIAILDWQISRVHSPVLDVSYYIYSTCSEEELEHFDELLSTYYSSFSTYLTELGCDPEILFPYSTLQKHWKQYGLYGVFMVASWLHLILSDTENIPESDVGRNLLNLEITNDMESRKRLLAVLRHYWNYDFS